MASADGGDGSALQVPYEPGWAEYINSDLSLAGSTMVANPTAWAKEWPEFFTFFHN